MKTEKDHHEKAEQALITAKAEITDREDKLLKAQRHYDHIKDSQLYHRKNSTAKDDVVEQGKIKKSAEENAILKK